LFLGDKNFMKTVAIIGASGYGGGELVRLLSAHPHVQITQVITDTFAGKPLMAAFPGLHKTAMGALICEAKGGQINPDIVFLAQEDTKIYTEFYNMPPAEPELLAQAVYGLPEKYREQIKSASLVANPGCHTTTAILPLFPLVEKGIIAKTPIIIDSKTGVSGAGRSKSDTIYRFSEMNETVRPYSVGGGHRHIPEIAQEIGADVAFTPHLIPMTRGILSTIYAPLSAGQTLETLYDTWHAQYENEPFVVVREPGDWPSTKDVEGSNFCHICATVDTKLNLAVLVSVTDNLMKGAAGQAVQNMNIMEGFDETAGLQGGGLWP
jgi:N-acetyl-gamma-glutamyl-phosphate reductase